jgi:RNA polymerase sigma-70 factor, ECF subfamily
MNETTKNTEAVSLAALKAGDRAEFARLVDLYSARIYRLALKMLADPQDAEDVLQETFLKALRSLRDFEGRSSLSTWLFRIAVNESLMLVRKRRPEPFISLDESSDSQGEDDSEPLQITDWCCLPERELEAAESRRHLDKAVDRLPVSLRVVFLLRDIEGLSIKETAEALSLSEVTVKTRLFRARMKLREDLSVYFAERLAENSKNDQS